MSDTPQADVQPTDAAAPPADVDPAALSVDQVRLALRKVKDPELNLNIVDLGLVYDLHIEKLPSGFNRVNVKMTLTAPGCGMGPTIARDAQEKIMYLDGVEEADVEVVWDPPWHQSMITAEGRRILGLE